MVLRELAQRTCWLVLLCFGAIPLTPSDQASPSAPAPDTQVAGESTPEERAVTGGPTPAADSGTSEPDVGSGLDVAGSNLAASRSANPRSPRTARSRSSARSGSFLAKAPFTLLPGDIVLTQDDGVNAGIIHVDPTTGAAVTVVTDPLLAGVSGIAIDASSPVLSVLVTVANPPELLRIDPATGVVTSLKLFDDSFFFNASDVAVEDDGKILVVAEGVDTHPPAVRRYDPVGMVETDATDGLSGLDGDVIGGIAIEADGNIIFSLKTALEFRRINRITKVDTTFSSGGTLLVEPARMAIAPDGGIIVAEFGDVSVLRVDPVTGVQAQLSTDMALSDPFDVAIEADGSILVADLPFAPLGAIFRLAPGTFVLSTLSATLANEIKGMAVVPAPHRSPVSRSRSFRPETPILRLRSMVRALTQLQWFPSTGHLWLRRSSMLPPYWQSYRLPRSLRPAPSTSSSQTLFPSPERPVRSL